MLECIFDAELPASAICDIDLGDRSLITIAQISLPLPDLPELEPEWVGDWIRLSLNWFDVYERSANEGEIAVEVCLDDVRIGYLRRDIDPLLLANPSICELFFCVFPAEPYLFDRSIIFRNFYHD
jgi:hypothetical protein